MEPIQMGPIGRVRLSLSLSGDKLGLSTGLRRSHLKTEIESTLRNAVFWNKRKNDVQDYENYTKIYISYKTVK
jgi:hypothetical protein